MLLSVNPVILNTRSLYSKSQEKSGMKLMYEGKKVSITIPVYNESKHIQEVIENIPNYIDFIVVIDDASTDNTLRILNDINEKRLYIIKHDRNQGVGKSTLDGHNLGVEMGADILIRSDGDGQMDMSNLPKLIDPLIFDDIDYTKGNRMASKSLYKCMPKIRVLGNRILTFMTRAATGYWKLQDSQNGFTAIKVETYNLLRQKHIKNDYRFENSMLYELSLVKAKIKEVDMPAIYGDEKSSIRLATFIPKMLIFLAKLFFNRIFRKKET
ncbi:MAG: glycosyltransferase family 2 protein [Candidatus Heimdallarchaeaceae archaeon]